jgi:Protein of unknown function (DUF4230)
VLRKLISLGEFHGAQAQYALNFTYVVHHSVWFFTGESIQVTGSGTDDAIVDFSGLARGQVLRPGATSVSLMLPFPYLGTPAVNLGATTLSEKGGLFTRLSHLFESNPNDAKQALAAAQRRIAAAAANSQLISEAETSTRFFLIKFLRHLGFTHVTVVFA